MKNLKDILTEGVLSQNVKNASRSAEIEGEFAVFKKEIERLKKLPRVSYEVKNGKSRFYPQQPKIWNFLNDCPAGTTISYTNDKWLKLNYKKDSDDRWYFNDGEGDWGYRCNVQVVLEFLKVDDPDKIQIDF